MNNYISYMRGGLLTLAIAALFSACNFLDKEPHSLVPDTYFNSESELNSFLLGVYSPLMQEKFYGNQYPTNISGGDDLSFWERNTNIPVCIMCANTTSSDVYLSDYWKVLYQGINRANMLIENADRNPSISASVRSTAKAEATCLRAFYYFHLVQGWGDVPFMLESTKSVEGQDRPRVDKEKIYDQIVADMSLYYDSLPELSEIPTPETLSKTAVAGILARVWLFRAGECYRDNKQPDVVWRDSCFTEARRWANVVYTSGQCDLVKPYSRVFLDYCEDLYNSTGVRESIWEVAETGNNTTGEAAAGRIGNVIGLGLGDNEVGITTHVDEAGLANPGYGYGFVVASLKLYEMYEENGDTARGDWNIAPFTYTTAKVNDVKSVTGRKYYYGKERDYLDKAPAGYTYTVETEQASLNNKTRCSAKYRREYEKVTPKNKNYTPINFPILRYSDVLLMLAEAENEIEGPNELVYECINKVRARADVEALPAGLSKEEMREKIKEERAMELCFEALRRWDLIRWGDFVRDMRSMEGYVYQTGWKTNYQHAAQFYRNITEAYNYFPIPDSETSLNKAITSNNPGW